MTLTPASGEVEPDFFSCCGVEICLFLSIVYYATNVLADLEIMNSKTTCVQVRSVKPSNLSDAGAM